MDRIKKRLNRHVATSQGHLEVTFDPDRKFKHNTIKLLYTYVYDESYNLLAVEIRFGSRNPIWQ